MSLNKIKHINQFTIFEKYLCDFSYPSIQDFLYPALMGLVLVICRTDAILGYHFTINPMWDSHSLFMRFPVSWRQLNSPRILIKWFVLFPCMVLDFPNILHVTFVFWYIFQIRDLLLTSIYSYLKEALKSLIDKICALQNFLTGGLLCSVPGQDDWKAPFFSSP